MSKNAPVESDTEAGLRAWSKEYDTHVKNPPKEGDILTTPSSDTMVALVVELKEDNPPFIYGRAFVPEIVGASLGWFLQHDVDENFHGWMCIILPRARTELIRKFGLQNPTIYVKSLRMVRESQSGKALLCEIHEYGSVEDEAEVHEDKISEPETKVEVEFEAKTDRVVTPSCVSEPEVEVEVSEPMC